MELTKLTLLGLLSFLVQALSVQDTLSSSEQGSLVSKAAKKAQKEKNILTSSWTAAC
jgi:hypothetical protein